jgi:AraC-like DNA-binding protein
MLYLEKPPSPSLSGFIYSLWYTCAPVVSHERERVLPNGTVQIILSLGTDALTDCGADSGEESLGICRAMPAAILVGARGRYDVIHMRDMAELMGVVFRPGGVGPWLRQPADSFFEQSIALDGVWNGRDVRSRLQEANTPAQKLSTFDQILCESLRGRDIRRRPLVRSALMELRQKTVRQTAQSLGISERRLLQIFNEDVGLSPKLWSRVHRFQRAVHALHSGQAIRWERLALACGYYDQPHFSKDFHSFSGIDPTTYCERRGRWRNHIPLD